ncbi:hypothetical protein, partial [Phenylobacterium sp.]|uniref:TRAFAC clade GTPase domain-containing protein n=1 Tax=Phenylobacterium sp. TaxID=1871053 RepID=UPI0025D2428B
MQNDDTPPRWQIAMLGSTSAGKTCYIGSFYAFHQVDVTGHGVNTSGFTVTGNAFTQGKLSEIAEELHRNPPETPDPTERIVDYNLHLQCAQDGDVVTRELHLHDHAGEALRWRRFSVQFGGLAKVGSGSDYAASLCSGLALS